MAGMKFEYDESGYKFVYFLISFYAMIIIPATYYLWPRKETKSKDFDLIIVQLSLILNRFTSP